MMTEIVNQEILRVYPHYEYCAPYYEVTPSKKGGFDVESCGEEVEFLGNAPDLDAVKALIVTHLSAELAYMVANPEVEGFFAALPRGYTRTTPA